MSHCHVYQRLLAILVSKAIKSKVQHYRIRSSFGCHHPVIYLWKQRFLLERVEPLATEQIAGEMGAMAFNDLPKLKMATFLRDPSNYQRVVGRTRRKNLWKMPLLMLLWETNNWKHDKLHRGFACFLCEKNPRQGRGYLVIMSFPTNFAENCRVQPVVRQIFHYISFGLVISQLRVRLKYIPSYIYIYPK